MEEVLGPRLLCYQLDKIGLRAKVNRHCHNTRQRAAQKDRRIFLAIVAPNENPISFLDPFLIEIVGNAQAPLTDFTIREGKGAESGLK